MRLANWVALSSLISGCGPTYERRAYARDFIAAGVATKAVGIVAARLTERWAHGLTPPPKLPESNTGLAHWIVEAAAEHLQRELEVVS